jgi:outer membrane lipoprotein-sorting protein
MRTLLATAVAGLALLVASLPAHAQTSVADVERYLNSIRTFKARFVQSNPNGSIAQGTLYVWRPGRMRFEYDPPSQLKIVADGYQVTMWDPATKDFGQWPIGWTAASWLAKDPIKLSGDLQVEKFERASNGLLEMTMTQARKPQEGKVIVRFSENPMALQGWTIIDSRGRVNIALTNVQPNVQLTESLFKNDSGR